MNRLMNVSQGLRVKSGIKSGAIVCFDDSNGYLMPVVTPCSTSTTYPPPTPAPPPGVQMLSCQSCTGTRLSNGDLQNAACEVCYM